MKKQEAEINQRAEQMKDRLASQAGQEVGSKLNS